MLPKIGTYVPVGIRWFTGGGCVLEQGDEFEVSVGGLLIGRYHKDDIGTRNAILVGLAADPRMHLGQLATAFGLSSEMLRRIRRRFEGGGLAAVVDVRRGGEPLIDDELRQQLEAKFAARVSVRAAHASLPRERKMSIATVGVARRRWGERQPVAAAAAGGGGATSPDPAAASSDPTAAPPLPLVNETSDPRAADARPAEPAPAVEAAAAASSSSPTTAVSAIAGGASTTESGEVRGASLVQHVGSWLLLGTLEQYGIYGLAREVCAKAKEPLDASAVRVALDAFVVALALRQGNVEGVRRVATPTAPELLRTTRTPCADWVRRTLGDLADSGAERFHLGMAGHYLEAARSDHGPSVYYIDNHLRSYSGQKVLRRGWRMQDKRVRPGTTDYYLHDEDGCPVLRLVSPSHAPLTEVVQEAAGLLRAALGEQARILLAFDRAGAYPGTLAALREESFEFTTYERRPFRLLAPSEFDRELVLEGDEEDEPRRIRFAEFRVALGGGRGDVRRIALRTDDERQVNILAISQEPAERLIPIQLGRWCQENGLKHGVERWCINHLDGRRTQAYPPETIVPNPARRRLDHALRLACVREGLARRDLARFADGAAQREKVERDLAEALALQEQLLARRATTPKKAPLAETELAGRLVYHRGAYKTVLDTIRIACANAEADLAETLAPLLPRAAEAKMTIGNLLAAPGRVQAGARTIRVDLAPAGTGPEQDAFRQFFAKVNAADLRLPGDPRRRALRFGAQLQ